MLSDILIDRTRSVFPLLSTGDISIEPLVKGGSDRRYYRMRMTDAHSMILVKYGGQVEENRHYVAIARFLDGLSVRVPRIFFHDEEEGLIWMEDLGTEDLWAHRDEPWEVRRALYLRVLDQALRLHGSEALTRVPADLQLQGEFNEDLYRWEQGYFFDHCLGTHFKLPEGSVESARNEPLLGEIASRLAGGSRSLVHRDFQSQNIIIFDGEACLIDFQGLRPGLLHYDLASLLYDPYVSLAPEERRELLEYYTAGAIECRIELSNDFEEVLHLCALQRLMQALGAYGFLGHIRRRPDFLAHIPVAMGSLREVLEKVEGTDNLRRLLDACGE